MSGLKYRFRPVEKVVEEVKALDGRFIYFVDDNIIDTPRRAKELFKSLRPLNLLWASQVTINFARVRRSISYTGKSSAIPRFSIPS